MYICTTL